MQVIARNRRRIDVDLTRSRRRKYFSPALYGLVDTLVPRLVALARGRLLDAGCGTMPYRHYVEERVDVYDGLDVEARVPGVKYLTDVQEMQGVPSQGYETVLSSEVLEHIPRPDRALSEIHRVLAPGGTLILTVPFLGRLHEEPHDFYRYTRYALEHLVDGCGLIVREIVPTGSIFSFLGHQLSLAMVCSVWHVPVLKHAVFWLNAVFVTLPCRALDRIGGLREKFPLGYVLVAEKPIR